MGKDNRLKIRKLGKDGESWGGLGHLGNKGFLMMTSGVSCHPARTYTRGSP